jgi:hypothetical protein
MPGDHRVGNAPMTRHILLAQALGIKWSKHEGEAPWRMAQKSPSNKRNMPITYWHYMYLSRSGFLRSSLQSPFVVWIPFNVF